MIGGQGEWLSGARYPNVGTGVVLGKVGALALSRPLNPDSVVGKGGGACAVRLLDLLSRLLDLCLVPLSRPPTPRVSLARRVDAALSWSLSSQHLIVGGSQGMLQLDTSSDN